MWAANLFFYYEPFDILGGHFVSYNKFTYQRYPSFNSIFELLEQLNMFSIGKYKSLTTY